VIQVLVERASGRVLHPGQLTNGTLVRVEGQPHVFHDCTDRPAPTIGTRPIAWLVRVLPDGQGRP